ncbi:MAG: signal peptidase II [Flavobacteriales bacterium]|nr:signal peptidase II [Flavobacteriales bacterium]
MRTVLITILSVLCLDQWLKLWVKTSFHYGEAHELIPGWLELQFVENPGMAFGWVLPGAAGKLTLSIFRIVVVIGISYYLWRLLKHGAHRGYIFCISLIIAGALGNIIDSAVYGRIFDIGAPYDNSGGYVGLAQMNGKGYAPVLMGNVVDMFHFSKTITINEKTREIFPPVFNLADAAITSGIVIILLFQRRFFRKKSDETTPSDEPQPADTGHTPEAPDAANPVAAETL